MGCVGHSGACRIERAGGTVIGSWRNDDRRCGARGCGSGLATPLPRSYGWLGSINRGRAVMDDHDIVAATRAAAVFRATWPDLPKQRDFDDGVDGAIQHAVTFYRLVGGDLPKEG